MWFMNIFSLSCVSGQFINWMDILSTCDVDLRKVFLEQRMNIHDHVRLAQENQIEGLIYFSFLCGCLRVTVYLLFQADFTLGRENTKLPCRTAPLAYPKAKVHTTICDFTCNNPFYHHMSLGIQKGNGRNQFLSYIRFCIYFHSIKVIWRAFR